MEAVRRHLVGRGEELARVVGRDQAEGGVGAPVHDDLGVHRGERPVSAGAGAVVHVEGVAAPVGVEDLFPRVEDLHRTAGDHGELGDAELQVEGLGLAAEGAADGRLHDPHRRRVQLQHPGQLPVQVVGHLGRGPHRHLARGLGQADGAVGLDRRMRGAFEEVVALHDHAARFRRLVHPGVHVAERQLHDLGDVPVPPFLAGLVDEGAVLGGDRLVGVQIRGKLLVFDFDKRQRSVGRVLVDGGHGGHAVAHVADPVHAEGVFVGRPGDDPVGRGHVAAGHDGVDAFEGLGPGGVDRHDAGMGMRAAEDLPVKHPRKRDVVGVPGPAGGLGQAVHLPHPPPDHGEALARREQIARREQVVRRGQIVPRSQVVRRALVARLGRPLGDPGGRTPSVCASICGPDHPAVLRAAASTAS